MSLRYSYTHAHKSRPNGVLRAEQQRKDRSGNVKPDRGEMCRRKVLSWLQLYHKVTHNSALSATVECAYHQRAVCVTEFYPAHTILLWIEGDTG